MSYIKVKDKDNLLRDKNTNALVNCDTLSYQTYEENYKKRYIEIQKIKNIENDVNMIKDDLNEIKKLLRNLSNGS